MKKFCLTTLWLLCVCASPAGAGFDAAGVSADQIPWSGYWWPRVWGELVMGYSSDPSPLEKYDAYTTGYFPAAATAYGMEHEYNPDALSWEGHCDQWAAAAILEPEPSRRGDLLGISFQVGDKKGLLTLSLDGRLTPIMYGKRYAAHGQDLNDIYPGGIDGFHQTLVNYIALQGLPVIMDLDPNVQVWNYPAYRYEMQWYDEGDRRHVTCTLWLADDDVNPDFVGTKSITRTYFYWLQLDANGNLADAPGGWEGVSIDDHPDFLWFPVVAGAGSVLEADAVADIVTCELSQTDDRFEDNDEPGQAYAMTSLQRGLFYPGSAWDEDWYTVSLQEGDDFVTFAWTSQDALDIQIYDDHSQALGTRLYNGARLAEVPKTGTYYVGLGPMTSEQPHYSIEFFRSPLIWLPHIAFGKDWQTGMTLLNADVLNMNLRVNLFDSQGLRVAKKKSTLEPGQVKNYLLNQDFSSHLSAGAWAKVVNLEAYEKLRGFFSYEQPGQLVNLPVDQQGADRLFVPHVAVSRGWWTGIALLNLNPVGSLQVSMNGYDSQGSVVGARSFQLEPGQNQVAAIQQYWGGDLPANIAWVEFAADGLMDGFVLWGNQMPSTSSGLAGIPLLRAGHTNRILYIPHLDTQNGWWTGIAIVNANPETLHVAAAGYGRAGNLLATGTITVSAYGNWVGLVQALFTNWDEDIAWVRMSCDRPVTGFQLVGNSMGRLAALPLATAGDASNEFCLTFMQKADQWWAGLVLLNSDDKKVDIWADPFDREGNRLASATSLWYNVPDGLPGRSNAVALVEQFFPGLPPQTAYLRIHSEGPVVGFGLSGDPMGDKLDVLALSPLPKW